MSKYEEMNVSELLLGWSGIAGDKDRAPYKYELSDRIGLDVNRPKPGDGDRFLRYIQEHLNKELGAAGKVEVTKPRVGVVDEYGVMRGIKGPHGLGPVARFILDSGWNYVDPARKMGKPPEEIEDYLLELADPKGFPRSWGDLNVKQQGLVMMICDAFHRWAHGVAAAPDQRSPA